MANLFSKLASGARKRLSQVKPTSTLCLMEVIKLSSNKNKIANKSNKTGNARSS